MPQAPDDDPRVLRPAFPHTPPPAGDSGAPPLRAAMLNLAREHAATNPEGLVDDLLDAVTYHLAGVLR